VIESTNLWGTTVSVEQTKKAFQRFFENFPSFDPAVPLYPALLMETLDRGETNINLNAKNISDFDANLYKLLVTYPSDVLPIADFVLGELRHKLQNPQNDPEVTAEINEAEAITSRPFNLIEKKNMRDLNPEDMDTLICVKGMVIRVGAIVPEMQRAAFSCALCAFETEVGIEDGLINEPVQCGNCQARHSYRLVHNRSKYFDKQLIKVQETPDSIPEGETPHSIKLCAFAQLVDFVKPGDRVEITGIYKALGSRVNPKRSALHTIYRTFVDTIHFRKMDVDRLQNESNIGAEVMSDVVPGAAEAFDESDATAQQTAEKEARILALSQEPEIYEKLTRSLAPSIWELEDVKKGILCLLFGGSGAEQGASSGKFRGEINVLMCGDPGQ
jgi:DNA replication licensing factor MCM4